MFENEENTGYDQNRKIFAFVGFALSSTINFHGKKEKKTDKKNNV